MNFFTFLCFLAAILINLAIITTAQTDEYRFHTCGTTGNFANNSAYENNLNQLLSSLSSNASTSRYGFANIRIGRDPDAVYGSFLCRGDLTNQTCQTCVEEARGSIIQRCPNKKESIMWYDFCMLRFSNRSFFSIMQTVPGGYLWNPRNNSNQVGFNRILGELMNDLVTEAAAAVGSSSSIPFFGSNEMNFSSFQKIHGLVQCNQDITPSECDLCLRHAVSQIPDCCDGKQGARVLYASCNLRYESYPFYEAKVNSPAPPPLVLPPPLTNSTTPEGNNGEKNSSTIVIAVVIPSAIAGILIGAITLWFCRRKRRNKRRTYRTFDDADNITTVESLQFDFETLRAATEDFCDANKLGEGGFGPVYKGQLSDGQKIAVKRLSKQSGQGDEQFKTEVVLVAKLQHRNLVRLLGFCFEGEEKLLIYEFVPNASLDHFLFDPEKRAILNWETRYRIIGGIARGMLYLHEDSRHRVIHRDLKASNILLDAEMNPKISDFGMARLFMVDQTQGNTSRIVGTYGYMSPEYAMHGRFSVKSDVFSFGVLLLEIITGHKNNSFYHSDQDEDLLSYAWRRWREGTALDLVDPTLKGSYLGSDVTRCIHIGLLCVQEDPAERPTMGAVVVMLTSLSVSLSLPSRPTFFLNSKMESGSIAEVDGSCSAEAKQALVNSRQFSENDASITEVYPR